MTAALALARRRNVPLVPWGVDEQTSTAGSSEGLPAPRGYTVSTFRRFREWLRKGPTAQLATGPSEFLEHETGLASGLRPLCASRAKLGREPATPTLAISFSAIPSSSVGVHSRPDSRT